MTRLRHLLCNQQINSDVRYDGMEYVLLFFALDHEQPIIDCPRCGISLDRAFAFGHLVEEGLAL